ncbi:DeoR/GlpR family DNA-binding transcription regulator [Fannyhessea vaginae]|uniref:DeoR/GlpR family DNA-binding transcription regulator n=1 Tax=Fannyhessea vaginae TaxID=82135 RepID=UPI0023F0BA00|nr:DeoR/GlpR family DNA-binding transcription regulator [Fannyhessea vaginae]
MSKRDSKILEILTEKKRIDVTTLAQMLNVSNVTARKDLDSLQDKGLVVREHGYALLANPNDVAGRLAYHYEEKRSIAQRAADFVYDGSTIMIENGSCCALLARIIGETKKNVSIITNSAFIAWYVRDLPEVHVTLLGGSVQPDCQLTVGPLMRLGVQQFSVEYLFIGTDGWSEKSGFTNCDQMKAEAVRAMADVAAEVVVVTEPEKFMHYGPVPIRLDSHITSVVTGKNIPKSASEYLEAHHTRVYLADK